MKGTLGEADNPKIVYIGPVGSGKSTQADLLSKHLGFPHLEMGELLRDKAERDDTLREILESGKLVDDSLTLRILKEELEEEKYKNGFVIDGVPRTIYQAQNLPFEPDIVIYLAVRDSENIKRLLLRKREDDTEDVIRHRLRVYHRETKPVLEFYREQGKLLEVDGEPAIEAIFEDILGKLGLK